MQTIKTEKMPEDPPPQQQQPAVQAVQLKLPPFWSADPELWIAQVEAQFRTRGITQDTTKYDYLVGSLNTETAAELRDILLNPPEEDKYAALRAALLKRNLLSDQKRLQELLSQEDLGDRRPSQVLRRMQQLVGDNKSIDDQLLRSLFIQKLPTTLQAILVTAGTVDIRDLAEMADKMMEVTTFGGVNSTTPHQTTTTEVGALRKEVQELKDLVNTLVINSVSGRESHSQQASRSASRGRSPFRRPRDSSRHPLCWYHHKFGAKSHRCEKPCAWDEQQGNEQTGLQKK